MRKQSIHALCAKEIRKELKKEFPLIKFKVLSDSFSGGNSVSVEWTNGPTRNQVEKFTSKYQYGYFNGMEDIYEITNSRNDISQVKYVQHSREISDEIKEKIFEYLKRTHNDFDILKDKNETSSELKASWGTAMEYIYRFIYKMDLTNGFQAEVSSWI